MWKNAVGPNGFLANPNLTISNTQVKGWVLYVAL
jgi:hypothetical protein